MRPKQTKIGKRSSAIKPCKHAPRKKSIHCASLPSCILPTTEINNTLTPNQITTQPHHTTLASSPSTLIPITPLTAPHIHNLTALNTSTNRITSITGPRHRTIARTTHTNPLVHLSYAPYLISSPENSILPHTFPTHFQNDFNLSFLSHFPRIIRRKRRTTPPTTENYANDEFSASVNTYAHDESNIDSIISDIMVSGGSSTSKIIPQTRCQRFRAIIAQYFITKRLKKNFLKRSILASSISKTDNTTNSHHLFSKNTTKAPQKRAFSTLFSLGQFLQGNFRRKMRAITSNFHLSGPISYHSRGIHSLSTHKQSFFSANHNITSHTPSPYNTTSAHLSTSTKNLITPSPQTLLESNPAAFSFLHSKHSIFSVPPKDLLFYELDPLYTVNNPHLYKSPSFFDASHPSHTYYKHCQSKNPATLLFEDLQRYYNDKQFKNMSKAFRNHRHDYLLAQETHWCYLFNSLIAGNEELEFIEQLTYLLAYRPINWCADPRLLGYIIAGCFRFNLQGTVTSILTRHFNPMPGDMLLHDIQRIVAYQPESILPTTLLFAFRYLLGSSWVSVAHHFQQHAVDLQSTLKYQRDMEDNASKFQPQINKAKDNQSTSLWRYEAFLEVISLQHYYNTATAQQDPYYVELFSQISPDLQPGDADLTRVYPGLYKSPHLNHNVPFDTPLNVTILTQFEALLQSMGLFWSGNYNTSLSTTFFTNHPSTHKSLSFSSRYNQFLPQLPVRNTAEQSEVDEQLKNEGDEYKLSPQVELFPIQSTLRANDNTKAVQNLNSAYQKNIVHFHAVGETLNNNSVPVDLYTDQSFFHRLQALTKLNPVYYHDDYEAFVEYTVLDENTDSAKTTSNNADNTLNSLPIDTKSNTPQNRAILQGPGLVFGYGGSYFNPKWVSINRTMPNLHQSSLSFARLYGIDPLTSFDNNTSGQEDIDPLAVMKYKAVSNNESFHLYCANDTVLQQAPLLVNSRVLYSALTELVEQRVINAGQLESFEYPFQKLKVPRVPILRSFENNIVDEHGSIISGPFAGYNPSFLSSKVEQKNEKETIGQETSDKVSKVAERLRQQRIRKRLYEQLQQHHSLNPDTVVEHNDGRNSLDLIENTIKNNKNIPNSFEKFILDPISTVSTQLTLFSKLESLQTNTHITPADMQHYISPSITTVQLPETLPFNGNPSQITNNKHEEINSCEKSHTEHQYDSFLSSLAQEDEIRFHFLRMLSYGYNIDPAGVCFEQTKFSSLPHHTIIPISPLPGYKQPTPPAHMVEEHSTYGADYVASRFSEYNITRMVENKEQSQNIRILPIDGTDLLLNVDAVHETICQVYDFFVNNKQSPCINQYTGQFRVKALKKFKKAFFSSTIENIEIIENDKFLHKDMGGDQALQFLLYGYKGYYSFNDIKSSIIDNVETIFSNYLYKTLETATEQDFARVNDVSIYSRGPTAVLDDQNDHQLSLKDVIKVCFALGYTSDNVLGLITSLIKLRSSYNSHFFTKQSKSFNILPISPYLPLFDHQAKDNRPRLKEINKKVRISDASDAMAPEHSSIGHNDIDHDVSVLVMDSHSSYDDLVRDIDYNEKDLVTDPYYDALAERLGTPFSPFYRSIPQPLVIVDPQDPNTTIQTNDYSRPASILASIGYPSLDLMPPIYAKSQAELKAASNERQYALQDELIANLQDIITKNPNINPKQLNVMQFAQQTQQQLQHLSQSAAKQGERVRRLHTIEEEYDEKYSLDPEDNIHRLVQLINHIKQFRVLSDAKVFMNFDAQKGVLTKLLSQVGQAEAGAANVYPDLPPALFYKHKQLQSYCEPFKFFDKHPKSIDNIQNDENNENTENAQSQGGNENVLTMKSQSQILTNSYIKRDTYSPEDYIDVSALEHDKKKDHVPSRNSPRDGVWLTEDTIDKFSLVENTKKGQIPSPLDKILDRLYTAVFITALKTVTGKKWIYTKHATEYYAHLMQHYDQISPDTSLSPPLPTKFGAFQYPNIVANTLGMGPTCHKQLFLTDTSTKTVKKEHKTPIFTFTEADFTSSSSSVRAINLAKTKITRAKTLQNELSQAQFFQDTPFLDEFNNNINQNDQNAHILTPSTSKEVELHQKSLELAQIKQDLAAFCDQLYTEFSSYCVHLARSALYIDHTHLPHHLTSSPLPLSISRIPAKLPHVIPDIYGRPIKNLTATSRMIQKIEQSSSLTTLVAPYTTLPFNADPIRFSTSRGLIYNVLSPLLALNSNVRALQSKTGHLSSDNVIDLLSSIYHKPHTVPHTPLFPSAQTWNSSQLAIQYSIMDVGDSQAGRYESIYQIFDHTASEKQRSLASALQDHDIMSTTPFSSKIYVNNPSYTSLIQSLSDRTLIPYSIFHEKQTMLARNKAPNRFSAYLEFYNRVWDVYEGYYEISEKDTMSKEDANKLSILRFFNQQKVLSEPTRFQSNFKLLFQPSSYNELAVYKSSENINDVNVSIEYPSRHVTSLCATAKASQLIESLETYLSQSADHSQQVPKITKKQKKNKKNSTIFAIDDSDSDNDTTTPSNTSSTALRLSVPLYDDHTAPSPLVVDPSTTNVTTTDLGLSKNLTSSYLALAIFFKTMALGLPSSSPVLSAVATVIGRTKNPLLIQQMVESASKNGKMPAHIAQRALLYAFSGVEKSPDEIASEFAVFKARAQTHQVDAYTSQVASNASVIDITEASGNKINENTQKIQNKTENQPTLQLSSLSGVSTNKYDNYVDQVAQTEKTQQIQAQSLLQQHYVLQGLSQHCTIKGSVALLEECSSTTALNKSLIILHSFIHNNFPTMYHEIEKYNNQRLVLFRLPAPALQRTLLARGRFIPMQEIEKVTKETYSKLYHYSRPKNMLPLFDVLPSDHSAVSVNESHIRTFLRLQRFQATLLLKIQERNQAQTMDTTGTSAVDFSDYMLNHTKKLQCIVNTVENRGLTNYSTPQIMAQPLERTTSAFQHDIQLIYHSHYPLLPLTTSLWASSDRSFTVHKTQVRFITEEIVSKLGADFSPGQAEYYENDSGDDIAQINSGGAFEDGYQEKGPDPLSRNTKKRKDNTSQPIQSLPNLAIVSLVLTTSTRFIETQRQWYYADMQRGHYVKSPAPPPAHTTAQLFQQQLEEITIKRQEQSYLAKTGKLPTTHQLPDTNLVDLKTFLSSPSQPNFIVNSFIFRHYNQANLLAAQKNLPLPYPDVYLDLQTSHDVINHTRHFIDEQSAQLLAPLSNDEKEDLFTKILALTPPEDQFAVDLRQDELRNVLYNALSPFAFNNGSSPIITEQPTSHISEFIIPTDNASDHLSTLSLINFFNSHVFKCNQHIPLEALPFYPLTTTRLAQCLLEFTAHYLNLVHFQPEYVIKKRNSNISSSSPPVSEIKPSVSPHKSLKNTQKVDDYSDDDDGGNAAIKRMQQDANANAVIQKSNTEQDDIEFPHIIKPYTILPLSRLYSPANDIFLAFVTLHSSSNDVQGMINTLKRLIKQNELLHVQQAAQLRAKEVDFLASHVAQKNNLNITGNKKNMYNYTAESPIEMMTSDYTIELVPPTNYTEVRENSFVILLKFFAQSGFTHWALKMYKAISKNLPHQLSMIIDQIDEYVQFKQQYESELGQNTIKTDSTITETEFDDILSKLSFHHSLYDSVALTNIVATFFQLFGFLCYTPSKSHRLASNLSKSPQKSTNLTENTIIPAKSDTQKCQELMMRSNLRHSVTEYVKTLDKHITRTQTRLIYSNVVNGKLGDAIYWAAHSTFGTSLTLDYSLLMSLEVLTRTLIENIDVVIPQYVDFQVDIFRRTKKLLHSELCDPALKQQDIVEAKRVYSSFPHYHEQDNLVINHAQMMASLRPAQHAELIELCDNEIAKLLQFKEDIKLQSNNNPAHVNNAKYLEVLSTCLADISFSKPITKNNDASQNASFNKDDLDSLAFLRILKNKDSLVQYNNAYHADFTNILAGFDGILDKHDLNLMHIPSQSKAISTSLIPILQDNSTLYLSLPGLLLNYNTIQNMLKFLTNDLLANALIAKEFHIPSALLFKMKHYFTQENAENCSVDAFLRTKLSESPSERKIFENFVDFIKIQQRNAEQRIQQVPLTTPMHADDAHQKGKHLYKMKESVLENMGIGDDIDHHEGNFLDQPTKNPIIAAITAYTQFHEQLYRLYEYIFPWHAAPHKVESQVFKVPGRAFFSSNQLSEHLALRPQGPVNHLLDQLQKYVTFTEVLTPLDYASSVYQLSPKLVSPHVKSNDPNFPTKAFESSGGTRFSHSKSSNNNNKIGGGYKGNSSSPSSSPLYDKNMKQSMYNTGYKPGGYPKQDTSIPKNASNNSLKSNTGSSTSQKPVSSNSLPKSASGYQKSTDGSRSSKPHSKSQSDTTTTHKPPKTKL